MQLSGRLETGKLENRDPFGTLRKPKGRDLVTILGPKTGKKGPNVTLEKIFNYKSTFYLCPCA